VRPIIECGAGISLGCGLCGLLLPCGSSLRLSHEGLLGSRHDLGRLLLGSRLLLLGPRCLGRLGRKARLRSPLTPLPEELAAGRQDVRPIIECGAGISLGCGLCGLLLPCGSSLRLSHEGLLGSRHDLGRLLLRRLRILALLVYQCAAAGQHPLDTLGLLGPGEELRRLRPADVVVVVLLLLVVEREVLRPGRRAGRPGRRLLLGLRRPLRRGAARVGLRPPGRVLEARGGRRAPCDVRAGRPTGGHILHRAHDQDGRRKEGTSEVLLRRPRLRPEPLPGRPGLARVHGVRPRHAGLDRDELGQLALLPVGDELGQEALLPDGDEFGQEALLPLVIEAELAWRRGPRHPLVCRRLQGRESRLLVGRGRQG